ncbi:MAG: glycosyltransferase family 4 protein, partial [Lachnospiraceae bacterium]|nr:glycosyltransferase family 4 protein [Lachnospiraceae bacterium]
MKILLFCSNPFNGGTAKMFYELYVAMEKKLTPQGHEVIAAVNEKNPVDIYKQIPNLVRLPMYSAEEKLGPYPTGDMFTKSMKILMRNNNYANVIMANVRAAKEYLHKEHIDCVLIHNGGYVGDDLCNQLMTAAYEAKVPKRYMVFHNDFEKNALQKLRYAGYDKQMSKQATGLITVSNFTRNRILENSYLTRDIRVIYNGIAENNSLSREEKLANLTGYRANTRNVLMIGNFMEYKGNLNFLKAVAKLKEQGVNDVTYTMIGNVYEKEYFHECQKVISEAGLGSQVQIYHNILNAAEYVDLFDFLVTPSQMDESFGLISVEAMAKGRAVVAFACGGIPEVVTNGRDGYVVTSG